MSQAHSAFLLCQGVVPPSPNFSATFQGARRERAKSKSGASTASGPFDQENSNFPTSPTW